MFACVHSMSGPCSTSCPIGVLYRPRATLRALIEEDRGHGWAVALAMVFGALQGAREWLRPEPVDPVAPLLGGALAGLLALYLLGWLARNFGRWFGGEVSLRAVRTGLGLGLLPWVLVFSALLVLLATTGDAERIQALGPLFLAGFVYGYVILLLALAEALRLGVLKAFLCLVITVLVSVFPLTFLSRLIF